MPAPERPIKEEMAIITEKTGTEFPEERVLVKNIGGTYIELFVLIEKIETISEESKLAILGLGARNFGVLQCAGDCIFNGYYQSGIVLLRTAYENHLLMSYLSGNNEEAKKWLTGKKFKPAFLKTHIKDNTLLYSGLSEYFVHTNVEALITSSIRSVDQGKISLEYYPYFSKETCRFSLGLEIIISWMSAVYLQYEFREYLWKNEDWKNRFATLNDIVLDFMQRKILRKT